MLAQSTLRDAALLAKASLFFACVAKNDEKLESHQSRAFPLSLLLSFSDSPDRSSKLVGYHDRQCDPDRKEEVHDDV